jgi:hypothetical protein
MKINSKYFCARRGRSVVWIEIKYSGTGISAGNYFLLNLPYTPATLLLYSARASSSRSLAFPTPAL